MKDGRETRVREEQMDFHVRSGFTRPTECNLSESRTRAGDEALTNHDVLR